ncbi:hypothetical protein C0Q70_12785 [Pomacea canaliculata]|uniref:ABC-type glutathione-S-conjugate transporter n=1 Tax=Pomacea canaliculata TaxID=400727 RepID=A0A2T7P2H4_POMCA|nr:hypothetical protein C0Q70_12785 [Pomacea canaliculata]
MIVKTRLLLVNEIAVLIMTDNEKIKAPQPVSAVSILQNSSFYDFNGWPRLTDCFLNTVLVWVPCAFLWCPLPFYLVVLARKGEVTPLPVTWLSSAKTFSSMVLSMVALVSLIQDSKLLTDSGSDVPPVVTYLASVLRLVSYLCTAFLTQHERRRQVITSGLQFVFWSLLMLCDIVPLYTAVIEERPCPEVTASFPSRMLFGYIYLGWQRDLTEADLFDLNPRDSSDVLVPSFEREWELERERFRNKQRGKPGNGTSADSTITSLQLLPKDSIEGDIHLPATVLETRSLVPSCSAHNSRGKLGVSTAYGTLYRPGDDEVKQETPSLLRVLVKLVGPRLILGLFANAVSEGILILCPVLLGSDDTRSCVDKIPERLNTCCRLLIEQVTSPDNNDKQTRSGYVLAVLMFVVYMVRTLLSNFSYWCSQVVGIQLKTILIAAIYKKSLTMNSAARRLAASGEITNLMSVDCQRIQDAMFFVVAWTTPLQVIIVVGVLYLYIGPSVFAGVIVLLLLVPLNSYISICQKKLNISNLKFKDKRLRLTNDMLSGMRVVKMYAWEPSFKKLITELRSEETKVLLRMSYLNMFMSVCGYFTPFLVTLATFATFVVVSPDNHLDARRVFVTLALLNLLRVPLDILTFLIPMTVQSLVSVQRINKFLCCEDLDTDSVTCDADAVDAISIRNGTFTWDKHYEPVLKNIDISVGVGRLVAVVGHVGSGKSSLISSLLGETGKSSSVAYVPQQAWIQNATIRDNVLFGKLFNLQRYQQVLRACALEPDLEILPAGDMTEIGERGINLSGGQKQRVSLARAVYSDSDIYLLDDPLSAVDSHVGKHIFTEVIGPNGLIGHKSSSNRQVCFISNCSFFSCDQTRVLVTHGIHWLPMVDEIIVLSDNGISEKGSYDTLMSHNGPFARFLKLHLQQREESEEEEDPEIIHKAGFRSLGKGEVVEFESRLSYKGVEATFVCGIGGVKCRGSDRRPMSKKKFQNKPLQQRQPQRRQSQAELQQDRFHGRSGQSTCNITSRPVDDSAVYAVRPLVDGPALTLNSDNRAAKSSLQLEDIQLPETQNCQDYDSDEETPFWYGTLPPHQARTRLIPKVTVPVVPEVTVYLPHRLSTLIKKIRENVVTVTSNGATSGEDLTCKDYSRRRKSTRTTSKSSWMTDSTKNKFSTCHLEEDTSQENNYRLVKEETIEKGNVKWSVFLTYIRAAGAVPFTASILFFLIFQAINASGNFWLSRWTDDNFLATSHGNATLRHNYKVKNDYYLMVFGMFGIGQIVTLVLSNFLIWVRTVVASQNLHSRLLASVLRSPMVFFDTTPVGRIINRFSRDIDTIDNILPNNIQESVSIGTMVLVTIIVISISTPLFIFLVIPVIILYFLIQTFYIPTSRQLKRMESVTHSPIYVHFSETISGGATIRAYRAVDRFIEEIKRRVDRNQSLYFASLSAHRLRRLYIKIEKNVEISRLDGPNDQRPCNEHGVRGEGEGILTTGVRGQQKSPFKSRDSITMAPWSNPLRRPDPSWPERGRLLFSEYSTRYRPGLDLVLRDISFVVEAGQKVGIVGRTGAGKSSLTLSLFRLIEACNGCIIIDGVNIADIGLHDLRSRITILPQDPVLFSGTLRMNLDPLSQYSDDQIWKSLETAQLKRFVEELPEKLNHQVGEGGQKLSVGQRQLVCLARSLLRRTKILVLDEATAAVDMETDSLIQNTIREAFSSCTIITIAHRLNTVMDYDRILVLDEGLVKEYDSPTCFFRTKRVFSTAWPRTLTLFNRVKDANPV